MPPITKNFGIVKALHVGASPPPLPNGALMLWRDTNENLFKGFDPILNDWVPINSFSTIQVEDIPERDLLIGSLGNMQFVFVNDATLDPQLQGGYALYVWRDDINDFALIAGSEVNQNFHIQNTDQFLDFGGPNQVSAADTSLWINTILQNGGLGDQVLADDGTYLPIATLGSFDWDKAIVIPDANDGKLNGTYTITNGTPNSPDPAFSWMIEMHRTGTNPANSGVQVAHPFGPGDDRPLTAMRFYDAGLDTFGIWYFVPSVDSLNDTFVNTSGDTMTGDLIMDFGSDINVQGGDINIGGLDHEIVFSDQFSGINFDGVKMRMKRIEIGAWDMDATLEVNIPIGIDVQKTTEAAIWVKVRDDNVGAALGYPIDFDNNGVGPAGSVRNLGSIVRIRRFTGGFFDSANFNDIGINRGYIWVLYQSPV